MDDNFSINSEDSLILNNAELREMAHATKVSIARRIALEKSIKSKSLHYDIKQYKDVVGQQEEELDIIKDEKETVNLELRKARYELRKSLEREKSLQNNNQKESLRNRTTIHNMSTQIETIEKKVLYRENILSENCSRLQQLLLALEK